MFSLIIVTYNSIMHLYSICSNQLSYRHSGTGHDIRSLDFQSCEVIKKSFFKVLNPAQSKNMCITGNIVTRNNLINFKTHLTHVACLGLKLVAMFLKFSQNYFSNVNMPKQPNYYLSVRVNKPHIHIMHSRTPNRKGTY